MVSNAEHFLVRCCNPKTTCKTFDELRHEQYHSNAFKFDLEKLPPTSASIVKHIQRAYYQTYIWLNSACIERIYLDPLEYGYILDDKLIPDIGAVKLPKDFPDPCTCLKCARESACPCRTKSLPCCQYCKCTVTLTCKNPYK